MKRYVRVKRIYVLVKRETIQVPPFLISSGSNSESEGRDTGKKKEKEREDEPIKQREGDVEQDKEEGNPK